MSNIDPHHLLPKVIVTAIEAGKETLEVYKTDFSVEIKSDDSPVTLADKRAHEVIEKGLGFSEFPILSEEGRDIPYSERYKWKHFWMIDPLDGTKEFIKKNSEFTVNIALIEDGQPILGVIYVPVYDLLYYASKVGSFKLENATKHIDKAIDLVTIEKLSLKLPFIKESASDKLTIVASKSHLNQKTVDYIEELKKDNPNISSVSRGSSLKLCLIAEGTADLYPRFGPTMEWDIAAGCAIIKYAGATINQAANNKPLVFNKENLVNPEFIAKKS